MDRNKTGELIAAERKEKNMTQKELAATLHVTDRAVSKWERGAGFPDVSLLEPLAAALDLKVLDLLRGERTEETDPHAAVHDTLMVLRQQRSRNWREFWKTLPALLVLLFALGAFGFLQLPVDRTETAYIYQNGEPFAVTEVYLDGKIIFRPWAWTYHGRFAASCVPGSMWKGLDVTWTYLPWGGELLGSSETLDCSKGYLRGETGLDRYYYVSPLLKDFAVRSENGQIIATTPEMYGRFVKNFGGPELQMIPFAELDLTGKPGAQFDGDYPPDFQGEKAFDHKKSG